MSQHHYHAKCEKCTQWIHCPNDAGDDFTWICNKCNYKNILSSPGVIRYWVPSTGGSGGGSKGGGSNNNKGNTGSPAPSREYSAAGVVTTLGWICLIAGVVFWFGHLPVGEKMMWGYSVKQIAIALGVILLILGYLSEVVAVVLMGFALWNIYRSGNSTEGFAFSNVPVNVYLFSGAVTLVGLVIGKIFRRG